MEQVLHTVRPSQHAGKKDGKADTTKGRLENNLADIARYISYDFLLDGQKKPHM